MIVLLEETLHVSISFRNRTLRNPARSRLTDSTTSYESSLPKWLQPRWLRSTRETLRPTGNLRLCLCPRLAWVRVSVCVCACGVRLQIICMKTFPVLQTGSLHSVLFLLLILPLMIFLLIVHFGLYSVRLKWHCIDIYIFLVYLIINITFYKVEFEICWLY